jgi:hypothetical protein
MRGDVQRDFDWQRRYILAWKRMLGEVLIADMPPIVRRRRGLT